MILNSEIAFGLPKMHQNLRIDLTPIVSNRMWRLPVRYHVVSVIDYRIDTETGRTEPFLESSLTILTGLSNHYFDNIEF